MLIESTCHLAFYNNVLILLRSGWGGVRFPNGIALSFKTATFNVDASVEELLEKASVIEGGETWGPNDDCWIP